MPKFRKKQKPIVIEAEQWFPGSGVEGVVYLTAGMAYPDDSVEHGDFLGQAWIDTLEGVPVAPGDWIITGEKGEKYPCKPDIFEATYEPVRTNDNDLVGGSADART